MTIWTVASSDRIDDYTLNLTEIQRSGLLKGELSASVAQHLSAQPQMHWAPHRQRAWPNFSRRYCNGAMARIADKEMSVKVRHLGASTKQGEETRLMSTDERYLTSIVCAQTLAHTVGWRARKEKDIRHQIVDDCTGRNQGR